jgi:DNA-binding SARP family transcriptional activator/tetratricopeptide (TPR) repeat protein
MSFKIYLLGQFKLQANHLPIELPSRPAQSLLAYLVLNAGVTHRREKLANLLWPETTETNARRYLRQALWRIRKSLQGGSLTCEDYLQISDISLTFNDQSDYWLDADLLLETTKAQPLEELTERICLYRGELLPGFYDEWIVLERERLQAAYHQKMNLLLESLIQTAQWDEAIKWSEHWIRLGYSPEPAFRAKMKAHAGLGDQTMASATYQRCTEALNRELGLEPSPETQRLYGQILRGELEGFVPPPSPPEDLPKQLPSFLDEGVQQQIEKTIFVARERELSQLDGFLDLTLAGQGRVVFVTGEAGSGKTALIQESNRRAQEMHPDLIVASGDCNAYTGIGDPYLPLREILGLLSGDVEARWAAGAMTREHARRLWNALPLTAQALLENGPDLIDTFIPGSALVERASLYALGGADWSSRLDEHSARLPPSQVAPDPQQSDLFEQYTRVLQSLARSAPLVLVVDDLQWADLGSISLLFHLGRHLASSRILILGAYRPEEVALGRDGERHPLEPLVSEFQRLFGDVVVDVDQAESRVFMEALLDSEPNQLGAGFRQMLFEQTRGQPLFTIELLRGMQERGDLVQDQEGLWRAGPALDWETLPARVEAVVAERINRLAQPLQAALRVASVEGETFTAEVVARVQRTDEREILGYFSQELDRRHRLIRAQSILRMDGQLLSSYRFQHILYQRYLYSNLDEVERVHLHERVGTVLEELYKSQEEITAVAPQLALHFQKARVADKAIEYLRQAGERAVQLSAYQEGIAHLNKGLDLLMTLPDSSMRAQQELELQLALGKAWIGPKAYGPESKKAFTRARELCQQLGKTHQLCQVLGQLAVRHFVKTEYHKARELAEEALSLAEQTKDPILVALSNWYLGFIWFFLGEYTTARNHLKHMIGFYRPEQHHRALVSLRGSDAGISALSYDALCLWCLGYPDQAYRKCQDVLALARKLDHPFSLADVLYFAGCLFNMMRRDWGALKNYSEEQKRLSYEHRLAGWMETATCFHGEAVAMLGQVQDGIAEIHEGMATYQPIGVLLALVITLSALAEVQAKAGNPKEGLNTLAKAFAQVEETGERHWETELHRLRGEILLMQGEEPKAEASFVKAIQVAQQQSAKSWELRASISLARLWMKRDKMDEARQLLAEIYNWFTEGFDTPDLKEAQALLESLP